MKNLAELLARFAKSLGGDTQKKEVIMDCVQASLGFRLFPEQVSIKGEVVEFTLSPIKKNEIKLHEAELLSQINERAGLNLKRVFYK